MSAYVLAFIFYAVWLWFALDTKKHEKEVERILRNLEKLK